MLTMSPFLEFFAILLELVQCTELVRQRNHWLVTKREFLTVFETNSMIPMSDWQTNINKMTIKAKKDIVKIENHCTKKIRLGYLESNIWGVDSPYWFGSWGHIFQYTPSSTGCLLEIILPALLGLYFPVHSQKSWTFTGKYYLVDWAILNRKFLIL